MLTINSIVSEMRITGDKSSTVKTVCGGMLAGGDVDHRPVTSLKRLEQCRALILGEHGTPHYGSNQGKSHRPEGFQLAIKVRICGPCKLLQACLSGAAKAKNTCLLCVAPSARKILSSS